ncbi:MAG: metalloregulator ArsR/SmtB family transcription factor [Acidobacteriia bacterium]|nr:metalloregulator ArsR/SmtB family transcription factor [Terriglobia bacterium]
MTQLSSLLKALSDPNRLRIVNILSYRNVCVGDLQAVLGLSQPFISRHLAYLRKAGLVRDRREGARVCYALDRDAPWWHALRSFLCETLELSPTFQADLRNLHEYASLGRLKSGILQVEGEDLQSQAA